MPFKHPQGKDEHEETPRVHQVIALQPCEVAEHLRC